MVCGGALVSFGSFQSACSWSRADLAENEELLILCKMFIKDMEAISSKIVDSWAVSAVLFPLHIMHFGGNMYTNASLHEKCQHYR